MFIGILHLPQELGNVILGFTAPRNYIAPNFSDYWINLNRDIRTKYEKCLLLAKYSHSSFQTLVNHLYLILNFFLLPYIQRTEIAFLPIPNAFSVLLTHMSSIAIFWSRASFRQCLGEKSCSGIWYTSCFSLYLDPLESSFGTLSSVRFDMKSLILEPKQKINVSNSITTLSQKIFTTRHPYWYLTDAEVN